MADQSSSVLERLRRLDDERVELVATARAEALKAAGAAIDTLNAMGFSYRLVEGKAEPSKAKKAPRRTGSGPCAICEFETDPAHDGRAHRGQKKKAPFTRAELEERGMAKA